MNTRSNQRGYTLYELIVCVGAFAGFGLIVAFLIVLFHFLAKVW